MEGGIERVRRRLERDLGSSPTTILTEIVSATATPITVTATSTITPTQTPTIPSPSSGSRKTSILFIVLITVLLLALLLGLGATFVFPLLTWCCAKRRSRQAAARDTLATSSQPQPGTELQPAADAAGVRGGLEPAPQEEAYGYYAPAGGVGGGAGPGKEEAVAAAREVYGYFSPTLAPRLGDVVRARPGSGT